MVKIDDRTKEVLKRALKIVEDFSYNEIKDLVAGLLFWLEDNAPNKLTEKIFSKIHENYQEKVITN